MVGIWGSYTSIFLQVTAILSLLVFTLPIFLVPLHWAEVLRWSLPEDPDLTLYFGRCLGGVGCVINAFALYVSRKPTLQPFFLQVLIGLFAVLTWVHILGAIQGVQPSTETYEIAFWAGLIVLTLCFYPVGRQTP
jgi:hypothetical protein